MDRLDRKLQSETNRKKLVPDFNKEFDFNEFYELAMRVLNGDSASMENLISLKERWQSKFHTPIDNPKSAKLKSVADREVTPYPSKISLLPREFSTLPWLPTALTRPKSGKRLPSRKIQNQMISNPNRLVFRKIQLKVRPITTCLRQLKVLRRFSLVRLNYSRIMSITLLMLFYNHLGKPYILFLRQKKREKLSFGLLRQLLKKDLRDGKLLPSVISWGKSPIFRFLNLLLVLIGKELQQVSATSSGFFFFRFKNKAAMENVIEGGPWLVQGQPIVLQCWEPGMSLRRQKHTRIPVWVRLKHLPMEYWTEEGLSTVASGVGTPLYTDKITTDCSRLDYARVCVMLDYNSTLPKHLVVMHPMLRDGKEFPTRIDVEYEWLPQRCKQCCSLGHIAQACPENKKVPHGAPVTVFVKKQNTTSEVKKRELETEKRIQNNYPKPTAAIPITDIQSERTEADKSHNTKGKDIILYNTFELLNAEYANSVLEINGDDDRISSGPNASSPQLGDT
ncbi:UNVERIFIED_CONTAM: hypothetical protein Sradi_6956000 [Sesamum radiatum]|uniref:DUF4283 domain-containing protein n=1 Tax=Sesamum radiatum TaxID=300843 RepID=A0AAW2JF39_SESRA